MNTESKMVIASGLKEIAVRLGGCVDLVSLLGWSAETSSISSGVLNSVGELLSGIYDGFQRVIDSAEVCCYEEGRARGKSLRG